MIIKILLTLSLGWIGAISLSQRLASRLSYWAFLFSIVGVYFVWQPNHATIIAKTVGVGRGADLLLYCWIVISLLLIVLLNRKLRKHMELITKLSRHIALSSVAGAPDESRASE